MVEDPTTHRAPDGGLEGSLPTGADHEQQGARRGVAEDRHGMAVHVERRHFDAGVAAPPRREAGSFPSLLLGSVAVAVTAHAHCPVVVVVRGTRAAGANGSGSPVVVGVDGSAASAAAVELAIAEAARRQLPLRALWAFELRHIVDPMLMTVLVEEEAYELDSQGFRSASLVGWREKYPDVQVIESV